MNYPNPYTYVHAPNLKKRISALHQKFVDLFIISLTFSERKELSFYFPGGDAKRADHGLVRREGDGIQDNDDKWFLHFRPWELEDKKLPVLFESKRSNFRDFDNWWPRFLEWNCEVEAFCKDCMNATVEFASGIKEDDLGRILIDQMSHPEAIRKHCLRFLHYDPRPIGEELAEKHNDFSMLTLDVFTTHDGLWAQQVDENCTRELIKDREDYAIAFFSRKAEVVTGGKIKGLCHGVVSTTNEARGAAVFFAHGPGPMGPSCPS